MGLGNGLSPDRQIGALEAELRHLRELFDGHKSRTASELRRIELRINAKSREIRDLESSINRAVLYLAIAAGAIIFDLIRKGTAF
ncbi:MULTISPECIES: hypothetical protein [Rhodomicrobium]|uniref:hypothetical protein n=1 Tax=Rhodomicrobium TaxID=1068 RepID=UPI000B4A82A1|nr:MULTISPECIES: hypothetical protein [Rhodomicrobium]